MGSSAYSIVTYCINCQFLIIAIRCNSYYYLGIDIPSLFPFKQIKKKMIEVFLFGIVLGLIPITLAGLFVTAYLQYIRGDQLDL